MKYTICVGIESDSIATKTLYSISKHYVLAFCDGIYDLCGYWVDSTATQTAKKMVFCNGISCLYGCWVQLNTHRNHKIIGVLQRIIVFVWLLSPTQYPHKEYRVCVAVESDSIPTNGISCFCDCWVDSVWLLSQTQYPPMEYCVFVTVGSTQYPHKSNIP